MNKSHLVHHSLLCLFLFIFTNATHLEAQRSIQGTPVSFLKKHKSVFSKKTKEVKVPALDMIRIKKEDKAENSNRFAAPIQVNYTLQNSGEWTDLEDGGRVWKLKLKVKNALGVFILYKNFYLPNGARLYVYNENKTQILGAYTNQNNSAKGNFLTGMIDGETAIIEYYEPSYAKNQGRFEIYEIMQAYDREKIESDAPFINHTGFGQSLECHENINCSWGDDLQAQKRGTVRMMTVYNTGIGWCTGALINNAENDGIPYILSAHHCGFLGANIANFSLWRFDFNYEFSGCADEVDEPAFVSLLGAEVISTAEPSDFLLLKMLLNVPSTYNAYFNGWDRADVVPSSGDMIHHPFGDVKKIAVDTNQLESFPFVSNWGGGVTTPPHSHLKRILDAGIIEGGSSGAPLFNPDGKIVGQLHGGPSSNCNTNTLFTYSGKFSLSWAGGADPASRLKDWLDPMNTGVTSIEGVENPSLINGASIFGNITREDGVVIPNVEMQVTGGVTLNPNNQADGTYEVLDLDIGTAYTVTPYREDNDVREGVNIFDLLKIREHILGVGATPLTPYQIIAADVNSSGDVNIFDMLIVRKIILQLEVEFPNTNTWRFIPANYVFTDPSDPLSEPFPEVNFYDPLLATMENQNFIAIKTGDVNNSAGL